MFTLVTGVSNVVRQRSPPATTPTNVAPSAAVSIILLSLLYVKTIQQYTKRQVWQRRIESANHRELSSGEQSPTIDLIFRKSTFVQTS